VISRRYFRISIWRITGPAALGRRRRRRNDGGNIREMALQAETMKRVTAGRDVNSVTDIAESKLTPRRLVCQVSAARPPAALPYSFIISLHLRPSCHWHWTWRHSRLQSSLAYFNGQAISTIAFRLSCM